MDGTIPCDKAGRLLMLQNSELDCLIGLDDVVAELDTLQQRATALRIALRTVRAEIRELERIAA